MTILRTDAARLSFASLLIAGLSACGGGSGGTASGSTQATGPGTEPAVPQASYTGAQNQAALDATNAYDYVQELFTGIQFLQLNSKSLRPPAANTYAETDPGSAGGTVTIDGVIASGGTGWIKETFDDYASTEFPGIIQNGEVDLFFNTDHTATLGLAHYQQSEGGFTYTYSGTITVPGSGASSSTPIVGSVSVTVGNVQLLLSGLTLTENADGTSAIAGKLYNSATGYVGIATPIPTTIGGAYKSGQFPNIYPNGSGQVLLSGAGGTSLQAAPLDGYFVYLGLDSTGSGSIDHGARLDLSTGTLDAVKPTGSAVSALIELPQGVPASGAVTADGRFSYSTNGFVSYNWSLRAAPFGSAVQVSGTGPTVQFTPDVVGDYLLELTASDGSESATDVVPVSFAGPSASGSIPATQYKVPSFTYAHAGSAVTLDARASTVLDPTGSPTSPNWILVAPTGSHATVADPTAAVTSFTPDIAGIYYLVVGRQGILDSVPATNVGVVSVDEQMRFAPPALVSTAGQSFNAGKVGSNYDSIGLGTISEFSNGEISLWTLGSTGSFSNSSNITLNPGEDEPVLATDLNGDGSSDFITPSWLGGASCRMDFRESGAGGYSFSSVVPVPSCTNYGGMMKQISAKIGGQPAVVALESVQNGGSNVIVFPTAASGSVQTPVITSVNYPYYVIDMALEDVDGDGGPDLIALISGITITTDNSVLLNIYHGNTDGSFTLKSSTPISRWASALVVGDFNGDSKGDITVLTTLTDTNAIDIYYGDGAGGISAPDERAVACNSSFIDAVDVNNDGRPDLIVGHSCGANDPTEAGTVAIGVYLSQVNQGVVSLADESFYPATENNLALTGSSSSSATTMHGNFSNSSLEDLAFQEGSALLFMPQLPIDPSVVIRSAQVARTQGVGRSASNTHQAKSRPVTASKWAPSKVSILMPTSGS